MRKITLAVVVLVLAASLASFAAEPAALSCASSGQGLALVETAAPAVPLFGPQNASWLQTPSLAAVSTAAFNPPKLPALLFAELHTLSARRRLLFGLRHLRPQLLLTLQGDPG